MKANKKLIVLLLFVCCLAGLFGCGAREAENELTTSTSELTKSITETAVTAIEPASETATSAVTTTVTATESTVENTILSTIVSTTESAAVSEAQSTTIATTAAKQVSVQIECSEINNNLDKFNENKTEFLPADGQIVDVSVKFAEGMTAFDALKAACEGNSCAHNCPYCKNGIQLEYSFTPVYKTYYVEGIHQLYEFDCGASSGWMYCVNEIFPDVGCSSYTLSDGDTIKFIYTCEKGDIING